MIKVLDRSAMGEDIPFERLFKYGDVEIYPFTTAEELASRISDAEICIVNKIKMTAEVLRGAPKLKLICVFATGYDNIDIEEAKRLGIAVCNVPDYSTDSVALCTVANVLTLFTHLTEYRKFVVSGEYLESGRANALVPVYHEMAGKKWGIVGFGNIGKRVAEVAQALGASILINKRTPIEGYDITDIDTLCRESDIITVHCPLNDTTYKLIDERRLSLMKPEVILVNEARGAVIDEAAISAAILNKKIGAFGSDVYTTEPFDKKHPFWRIKELDNVCLTPHCAWGAYESRLRCFDIICANIESFLSGKRSNRVDC